MVSDMEPRGDAGGSGRVLSVNVGSVREVVWQGRVASTGIWKSAVSGRVAVRGAGLEGDEQADRSGHGGPDKAVYAYALEDAGWWEAQLGRSIEPGGVGGDLTPTRAAGAEGATA